jgi:hypothetical protein
MKTGQRIPILHRNGGWYLVNPSSERLENTHPKNLPEFGPYKNQSR